MEVQPDILEKLLCSVCGEYLSCAPVRMKNDGAAICGRCCDPKDESTLRITPYEDLAEMFLFPCQNKTHGCTETWYMAEMKEHEEECEYRQYVCPVTEPGQCDWSGARKNILDHCQEQHRDKVLQDPYTIKHQINENNRKTFLLAAFQLLFIIHCKVCVTSKNIYHSVRLIGKCRLINQQYRYKLEVSNNEDTFTRRSDVAPQGCMSLQEDTSVCVDINTLLKYLGDFKDIIFKMKVGRKCVFCNKCVMKFAWPTDCGWCCKDCAPATRPCKFSTKGCMHSDIDIKANMHELLHCQYATCCDICKLDVNHPRERHFESAHSDVTHKAGVMWRAPVVNEETDFLITSDAGKLWCDYVVNESNFTLRTWSALGSEQLPNYRCLVKLTNPVSGHTLRKTLYVYYTQQLDWQWVINKNTFLMYVSDNEFNIQIELIKK